MNHRKLIGVFISDSVNGVKCEVITLRVLKFDVKKLALFVFGCVNKFLAEKLIRRSGRNDALPDFFLLGFLAGKNNRKENAVLAVNGNHTVGGRGIVIN